MNQLSPAERHEFLKGMEVEWQTLLQNHAAKVLSLEETAQAQARWPDRAVDTRWACTWKPDDSKPSGLRAKARLIIKGLQTLTSLTSSHILRHLPCSHGHKLQLGDVQQAFNTGDPNKRKEPLFVRMRPDGVPGESRLWTGRLHERMEELFPCCSRLGAVCFGLEEGSRQSPSWSNVSLSDTGKWEKGKF